MRGRHSPGTAVLVIWLLTTFAGCTSAARSVRVTPVAGQSSQQLEADAAKCDAWARKEARYQPVRPAGGAVVRGTADRPAHEVVGAGSGIGGTLGHDGGFVVGGKLGVVFGSPDRDVYIRLYRDCMIKRGYQPSPTGTGR